MTRPSRPAIVLVSFFLLPVILILSRNSIMQTSHWVAGMLGQDSRWEPAIGMLLGRSSWQAQRSWLSSPSFLACPSAWSLIWRVRGGAMCSRSS